MEFNKIKTIRTSKALYGSFIQNQTPYYHICIKYLLLLIFLFSLSASAQNYLFDLQQIGIENGAPTKMMLEIRQDKQGYLWFSSTSEIYRYDGIRFQSWQHEDLDLQQPMVATMAFDDAGRLWYANRANTMAGDSCGVIDLESGQVISMKSVSGERFGLADVEFVINPDPRKEILVIATHSGTYFKYEAGEWTEVITLSGEVWMSMVCRPAKEGGYWIANGTKLLRVDQQEVKEEYQIPMQLPGRLTSLEVVDGVPRLAVKTRRTNRNYILQGDSLVPFAPPGTVPEKLHKIMLEHPDFTVFTTLDSLLITDNDGVRLKAYGLEKLCDLKNSGFFANAFLDYQENLWITSSQGIIKVNIRQNPFKIHYPGLSVPGLGVLDGELVISEPFSDGIVNKHPEFEGRSKMVLSFFVDKADRTWMGTVRPYIAVYDPEKAYTTHIHLQKGHWSEYVYQNATTGNYWVSTNQGLYVLESEEPGLENYRMGRSILPDLGKPNLARDFYHNQEGIWVATKQGLFLINAEKEEWTEHFSRSNGFPAQALTSLHEDENGIFWLASMDGGLLRWDRENDEVRQFSVDDGFPSNSVSAVFEDEYQTLWLPSSQGLIAFDKTTYATTVYHASDGIASNRFNPLAHDQAEDGTIYLGTSRGITSFHPRGLQQKKGRLVVPLYLSRLEVLENDQENFTDQTLAFKEDNKIVLKPNDRILRVEVALLDYEKSVDNQYAYKLSGKEEKWIQTRENRFTLLNLPYGQYILKVKARGPSGIWTENNLEIPIEVLKPIYLRTYFLLSVAMLAILLVVVFVRYRVRFLKKIQKQLEREVDKRTRQIRSDKQIIETQAKELRAMDKAKSRFFSNITHEFRTPLTLIIGPVEQLLNEDLPKAALHRLSGVAKNARQLLTLINQLLDLSKLEGGQMKIEVSHGDIVHYTSELIRRFQPLAEKKDQKLFFNSALDSWETHFDKDKWNKIIYNLVSNAIKFTPNEGRIELRLEKVKRGENEFIHLMVKDTGIGMDKEALNRIFDRFYQVDASSTRLQGGTGIGLSLVKELVELQEGTISAKSESNIGTTFTIELPVVSIESPLQNRHLLEEEILPPVLEEPILAPNQVNEENSQAPLLEEESEKLTLLLIEDNVEMRAYIRECIDESTYQIIEARDGQEGIKEALTQMPDLIISDVMMPQKNGFEVVRAIRTNFITSHIPIILLTAKASLESRLTGFKRGADAYLTKPFSPQELTLRIQKLIEIRRMLQARYANLEVLPQNNSEHFDAEDEFMIKLKKIITENLQDHNFSPDFISKQFGVSRMSLYRKLKALTNQGISDVIRSVRLEVASNLIQEGQLNLSEIAYQTGFSSLSHFSRTFKKAYGRSPSDLKGTRS